MRKPNDEEVEPNVPADLREALAATPGVEAGWKALTMIGRRDFLSWINQAKQSETRNRRIRICCDKIASGKKRPCCFAVVPMDFYKALGTSPTAKSNWSNLTASQKRDFSDWIEDASDNSERKQRIEEACKLLVAGKQCVPT